MVAPGLPNALAGFPGASPLNIREARSVKNPDNTGSSELGLASVMLKSDKLEFERGAAAKTENEDRYDGRENRHHDRYGTAGS